MIRDYCRLEIGRRVVRYVRAYVSDKRATICCLCIQKELCHRKQYPSYTRVGNLIFPLTVVSVFGYYYFKRFCINSWKRLFRFVMAVCLSASISAAPSGRILMPLVIGDFN